MHHYHHFKPSRHLLPKLSPYLRSFTLDCPFKQRNIFCLKIFLLEKELLLLLVVLWAKIRKTFSLKNLFKIISFFQVILQMNNKKSWIYGYNQGGQNQNFLGLYHTSKRNHAKYKMLFKRNFSKIIPGFLRTLFSQEYQD